MTSAELMDQVVGALRTVAPEADAAGLAPDVPLRDQIDLDSMDALRIAIELKRRVGIEIPERDYPKLSTLQQAVDYLAARVPSAGREGSRSPL